MTYTEAAHDLVRAGTDTNVNITLSASGQAVDLDIFGEALSQEIEAKGYIGGAELPWIVEDLYIYSLEELTQRQAGYRYDARTNQISDAWDQSRYVIADWAANPVSIGKGGDICYSRHGEGHWTYAKIAADLPTFIILLAAWLRFFVAERGSNLFNEDFEIDDATREEIRNTVLKKVDLADRDAALSFLLGD